MARAQSSRLVVAVLVTSWLAACSFTYDFDKFSHADGGVDQDATVDDGGVDDGGVDDGGVDDGGVDDGGVDDGGVDDGGVDDGGVDDGGIDDGGVCECDLPNANTTCESGDCVLVSCHAGYQSCTAAPGCETHLETDRDNCGDCGEACTMPGQTCASGGCTTPQVNWFIKAFNTDGTYNPLKTPGRMGQDASGRTYIALSNTQGTRLEGSAFEGTVDVASTSTWSEIHLVVINPDGTIAWTARFTGATDTSANFHVAGILVDSLGYVYVAGGSGKGVRYHSPTGTNTLVRSVIDGQGIDSFIVKLNSSGVLQGTTTITGTGNQQLRSVALGPGDELIATGTWFEEYRAGGIAREPAEQTSGTFFIAYDIVGTQINFKRTRSYSGGWIGPQYAHVDPQGNVYFAGSFGGGGSLEFDSGTLASIPDPEFGFAPYAFSLTSSFEHRWHTTWDLGDVETVASPFATFGADGRVHLLFPTMAPTPFGSLGTLQANRLHLATLSPETGAPVDVRTLNVTVEIHQAGGVSRGPDGTIRLSLAAEGIFDLGGGPITGPGGSDLFLAEYTEAGLDYSWGSVVGGPAQDWVGFGTSNGVLAFPQHRTVFVGTFRGDVTLADGLVVSAHATQPTTTIFDISY